MERYPGAVGQPEDVEGTGGELLQCDSGCGRHEFRGQNLQGRLAAAKYNCNSLGLSCMWEFYSYTKGGQLLKKGLQAQAMTMEVGFEYDNKGKLAFMVYPGGKAGEVHVRQHGAADGGEACLYACAGESEVESDLVNGVTYGIAGEMKTMSWLAGTTQWATQSWSFNNRMQMTWYGYSGPGGPVSHSCIYSAANNDGKLRRRRDNVLGKEGVSV